MTALPASWSVSSLARDRRAVHFRSRLAAVLHVPTGTIAWFTENEEERCLARRLLLRLRPSVRLPTPSPICEPAIDSSSKAPETSSSEPLESWPDENPSPPET